jgi:hypothetical protein
MKKEEIKLLKQLSEALQETIIPFNKVINVLNELKWDEIREPFEDFQKLLINQSKRSMETYIAVEKSYEKDN